MKIRQFLLIAIGVLISTSNGWADDLTLEMAKQKAATFLMHKTSHTGRRNAKAAVSSSQMQEVAVDAKNLYVFNVGNTGGFVIIANDDNYDRVLGYSDKGCLDPNDMPEALQEILQAYNKSVGAAKAARRKAPTTGNNMAPVKPMLKTYYNQSGVYNMYLPIVKQPDEEGNSRRMAPTGCVSAAMAQIMAYWQWPKRVEAIPGYVMDKTGSDDDITVYAKNPNCTNGEWMDIFTPQSGEVKPLPAYNINWDNIYQGSYDDDFFKGKWSSASSYNKVFTDYWSGTTLAKMQEIGRLFLYACSSLQMYYTYTGSGAKSADMISLLPKYFGYKNQIKKNERRNFTQEAWEQLLYNEISNGRPVIYAGKAQKATGGTGAHAYIMDGYDGAGLWHVNWGWNGSCDGYYDFENLSPYGLPDDTDGYTVSETGYVINQICLTGIEPNTREGKLTVVDSEMKDNENGEPSVYVYFDNLSDAEVSRRFSWAVLNENGTLGNKNYGSYRTLTMPPSSTLSYDSKDQWYDDEHVNAHRRYYDATIEDLKTNLKLTTPGTYTIICAVRPSTSTNYNDCVITDGAENHVFQITVEATYDGSAEAADATVEANGNFTVAALEPYTASTGRVGLKAWYDNENDETLTNKVSWALLKDDGSIDKRYNSGWAKTIIPKKDATYQLKDNTYIDGEGAEQSRYNLTYVETLFGPEKWNITDPGTYKIAPTVNSKGTTIVNDYELAIGTDEHYFLVTLEKDEEGNITYSAKLSTEGLLSVAASEVKDNTLYAYFDNENTAELANKVTWSLLNEDDNTISGSYGSARTLTLPPLSECNYGKNDELYDENEEHKRFYMADISKIVEKFELTAGTYKVVPVCRPADSNYASDNVLAVGSLKNVFTITIDEHQNATATAASVEIPNKTGRLTVSYVEYKDGNLKAYFDNPNADIITNTVNIRRLKDDGTYQSFTATAKSRTLPTTPTSNIAPNSNTVTVNGKSYYRYFSIGAEDILTRCGFISGEGDNKTYTPGTYTFHMCSQPAGGSYMPCEGTDKYYFTVTLTADGTISVIAHPEVNISTVNCEVVGDLLTGSVHELQVTFKNNSSDEQGGRIVYEIYPVTYDENDNPIDGERLEELVSTFVLLGNTTKTFKMAYTFNDAGSYKVRARLENGGQALSAWRRTYCTIKQKTTERPNSQLTLDFAGIDGVHQVGNRFYLTGNKLEGIAVVTNTGTASTTSEMNTIIQLWSEKGSHAVKENLIDQVRIKGIVAPGQTVELPFHFRNLDLTPGQTYYFRTSYGTNGLTAEYNSWNTSNDNHWYEVKGTPSAKTWAADGEEATEWILPTYANSRYTYALDAQDKVAIDITNFEAVMTNTNTDKYTFTASSNPNALYFMSAEAKNKLSTTLAGKNIIVEGTAEALTLTDGYPFYTPEDFEATSASYSRTFTIGNKKRVGGGWQSVVLPFTVSTVKDGEETINWFKSANDNASFWVYQLDGEKVGDYDTYDLNFVYNSTETMDANTPYIMAVPDESWAGAQFSLVGKAIVFSGENVTINKVAPTSVETDHFMFIGTYTGATDLENVYVLNEAGKSFVSGSSEVQPFNAYIKTKNGAMAGSNVKICLGEDSETTIKGVYTDDASNNNVYDLQGRTMSTTGINALPKGLYIMNGKKVIK